MMNYNFFMMGHMYLYDEAHVHLYDEAHVLSERERKRGKDESHMRVSVKRY